MTNKVKNTIHDPFGLDLRGAEWEFRGAAFLGRVRLRRLRLDEPGHTLLANGHFPLDVSRSRARQPSTDQALYAPCPIPIPLPASVGGDVACGS